MVNADNVLVIPGPSDPWHTGSMVGFDLETTGPNPHEARIVTASIVLLDPDGQMRANAEWLVDPGIEIPAEADAVLGETTEQANANALHPTPGPTELAP